MDRFNTTTIIDSLCQKAKNTGLYLEGQQDPLTGMPMGTSIWALWAKMLWKLNEDNIPVPEDIAKDFSETNKFFWERFRFKEVEPGKSSDFISDLVRI